MSSLISALAHFVSSLFPVKAPLTILSPTLESLSHPHARLALAASCPRVYVVGDIHGCLNELKALVAKLSAQYNDPDVLKHMVLVGDLVNKGPLSAETVQFCSANRLHCVIGNHDMSLIKEIQSVKTEKRSYVAKYAYASTLSDTDVAYLEALPSSLRVEGFGFTVVHAGYDTNVPLFDNNIYTLTTVRQLDGGRGYWWDGYSKEEVIVYGHDAKYGFNDQPRTVGLDSGCCYGRKLTCCVLTRAGGRQFVDVPAERVYSVPNT
jgi:hypothetical protein